MHSIGFTIATLLMFVTFSIWNWRRSQAAMANMGPIFLKFLEQTGYRNPDMLQHPLAAQAEALAERFRASGTNAVSYVRDMNGLTLHHYMNYVRHAKGMSMSVVWEIVLPRPPRMGWHIAEKRFGSMGLAVKEVFTKIETVWSAAYPNRVESGDPELDARFQIYASHPDALRQVLAQSGLKQLLLGCVEVDLRVLPDRVTLSDPLQRNLQASMGGAIGAMAAGYDMNTMMQATIPMHTRIADLLYLAASVSA
jgi:hypothetical protein